MIIKTNIPANYDVRLNTTMKKFYDKNDYKIDVYVLKKDAGLYNYLQITFYSFNYDGIAYRGEEFATLLTMYKLSPNHLKDIVEDFKSYYNFDIHFTNDNEVFTKAEDAYETFNKEKREYINNR